MRRFALAVLLVASTANAQPAELTKEFQAGVDAYRLGKFDEARAHLEKARDIDPKLPGPYRFLAAVAQAQGRWDDCIGNARKALQLNPQSGEAADTRKVHDECRTGAGRAPYRGDLADSAAISVTTNVAGATVKINGLTYGGTPLAPRPITAGELEVEIDKAGWKHHSSKVDALPGIVTDVIVDLEADPNAQSNPDLNTGNQEKPKVGWLVLPSEKLVYPMTIDNKDDTYKERIELAPGTHVIEIRAPGRDPWRRRVRISAGQKTTVTPTYVETESREALEKRGFYVLGGGGALLATGFVFALLSRSAANEARDIDRLERSRDPSRPLSETDDLAPVRTRADLNDARDRHSRWGLISNITYGAGLVTVGIGAYFLYKGARERRDVPPPFAIAPVQGGAVVAKEVAW